MDTPAFVINLDRDTGKLAAVSARLERLGLRPERLSAVDGRSLTQAERAASCSRRCASLCPAAAIGCFLSHKKAWQAVVDRGLPRALVFEDDVAFHPGAVELIQESMAELPPDYHVLLLGCFTCQQEMLVETLIGAARGAKPPQQHSPHLIIPSQTFGSQAYLVSNSGARALLSLLSVMDATVDWQMGSAMKQGLRLFSTTPDATYQTDMDQSSIANRAPVILNTAMQQVPADRYRSIGWLLSVPLLSPAGITFSAWSLLFGVMAAMCPVHAWALLATDLGVGCLLFGARPKDYVSLVAGTAIGHLAFRITIFSTS